MDERIIKFIEQQTCATICCVDGSGNPYCFSCFYVFDEEGFLYFKSSSNSHHAMLMKMNPAIAGTILPDKLKAFQIKGIQFEGVILNEENELSGKKSKKYYIKHPAAYAVPGELWTVRITHIKMTDNTIGFGKKISWQRNEVGLTERN